MGYSATNHYLARMPNPMHDPRYAEFRTLLLEAREHARVTQVELASRLGKPQSYVSKYERGERRLDMIEFIDVARALGIDPLTMVSELRNRIS